MNIGDICYLIPYSEANDNYYHAKIITITDIGVSLTWLIDSGNKILVCTFSHFNDRFVISEKLTNLYNIQDIIE